MLYDRARCRDVGELLASGEACAPQSATATGFCRTVISVSLAAPEVRRPLPSRCMATVGQEMRHSQPLASR